MVIANSRIDLRLKKPRRQDSRFGLPSHKGCLVHARATVRFKSRQKQTRKGKRSHRTVSACPQGCLHVSAELF